jgi:hypothetical protein
VFRKTSLLVIFILSDPFNLLKLDNMNIIQDKNQINKYHKLGAG